MNIHKKYIKKEGKTFGPYYYHSYRVGNKIKTKYLGNEPPAELKKKSFRIGKDGFNALKVFGILLIAGLLLFSLNGAQKKVTLQNEFLKVKAGVTGAADAAFAPAIIEDLNSSPLLSESSSQSSPTQISNEPIHSLILANDSNVQDLQNLSILYLNPTITTFNGYFIGGTAWFDVVCGPQEPGQNLSLVRIDYGDGFSNILATNGPYYSVSTTAPHTYAQTRIQRATLTCRDTNNVAVNSTIFVSPPGYSPVTGSSSLNTANQTYELMNNITGTGTAITINATNVTLDCRGSTINFSQSIPGEGINITNFHGTTIKNCVILQENTSVPGTVMGIRLTSSNNNTIINTNISIALGTSYGVSISGSSGNNFTGNNLLTDGIAFSATTNNSIFQTNTIISNSNPAFDLTGSYNILADNFIESQSGRGLVLEDSSTYNQIDSNTINATSTGLDITGSSTQNNIAFLNSITAGNIGVYFQSSNSNSVFANDISGTNYGIAIQANSNNVSLNLITTSGEGISLFPGDANELNNNLVISSNIGVQLQSGSNNNRFAGNNILASNTYLISDLTSTGNNLTNNTFFQNEGSVLFPAEIEVPADAIVNTVRLNISLNYTFLNSSEMGFLNESAIITLTNLNFIEPQIMVALDDSTFSVCTECNNLSWDGSTFVFNVSHFTTYIVEEAPPAQNLTCGDPLNETNTVYYLNNSVNSSGTCFTVNATGVTLNCNGFIINGTDSGNGIFISGRSNVTIVNCGITNFEYGIFLNSASNNNITSNVIDSIVGRGIYLQGGHNNQIVNNNISSSQYGILTSIGTNNNTFISNTVNSNNYGLFISTGANNIIDSNTASSNGEGIILQSGSYNNLTNNTASSNQNGISLTSGTNNNALISNEVHNNSQYGLYLSSGSSNLVINNSFGLNGDGIRAELSSSFNIFESNNVINNTEGIFLLFGPSNNNFSGNLIADNGRSIGLFTSCENNSIENNDLINAEAKIDSSSGNSFLNNRMIATLVGSGYINISVSGYPVNFTNNSFITSYGSVNYPQTLTSGSFNGTVSQNDLAITFNRTFLNSTIVNFLNDSAIITLTNLSFTNPQIMVALDDSAFSVCSDCNNLSWNGSTLIFNVSHFTTYAVQEAPLIESNLSCGDPLNETGMTYYLNNSVNSSGTCFTISANNVTLDCQGFTINYSQSNLSTEGYGAIIENFGYATIKNCNIVHDVFINGQPFHGIYILNSSNNLITNNNITVLHALGSGIALFSPGSSNVVSGNRINASEEDGIWLYGVTNNIISGNIITRLPVGTQLGDYTFGSWGGVDDEGLGNQILNNNITSDFVFGSGITAHSSGGSISGNIISVGDRWGIQYYYGNSKTISSNVIETLSGEGIQMFSTTNNNINNNIIRTRSADGIQVAGSSGNGFNGNIITNNFSGGAFFGLSSKQGSFNNTFDGTTIKSAWGYISTAEFGSTSGINLTNTLLSDIDGISSVNYPQLIAIPVGNSINQDNLNITFNKIHLNNTDLPFLNVSAELTFNNITAPNALVDFNDDGFFELCPSEICTNVSYSGSTYVFNVTHFTTYAAEGNVSTSSTDVSACGTLGSSNTNYVLTANLVDTGAGACINFIATNSTLDCQGKNITCDGNFFSIGIELNGNDNAIRNCRISNCGTNLFLDAGSSSNNLTNNTLVNSPCVGLYADSNSNNNQISGNTANNNNCSGIGIHQSSNNSLFDNFARNNTHSGIALDSNSNENEVYSNVLNENLLEGISVSANSDNNILASNTANSNSYGFFITSSSNNNLSDNVANLNINEGIRVESGSNSNTLTNNTANSNSNGISLRSSIANTINFNNASLNNNFGIILVANSDNNTLTSNIANSNSVDGIFLQDSSNGNIITSNTASSNIQKGINFYNSSSNQIYNNFLNNTDNTGSTAGSQNSWNYTKTTGTNIIGGPNIGGNFYASPNETGFSESCTNTNGDGICDSANTLDGNNVDYLPLTNIVTSTPAPSSGGGGGGGSSYTAPNVTICQESWQCEDWSACSGGQQTRLCSDQNKCGTATFQPAYSRSCQSRVILGEEIQPAASIPKNNYWWIVAAILAGMVVMAAAKMNNSRKKKSASAANYWENEAAQAYKKLKQ